MKRAALACTSVVFVGSFGLFAGCSSTETTPAPADGGGGAAFALEVACNDTPEAVYGDPGTLPPEKGAILKCTKDPAISKEALEAEAKKGDQPYKGKAFTSGARVYRVTYRTERGDAAKTAGYSSAIVYVPDNPKPGTLPIVVASHGSRGQAEKCAPSKNTPDGAYVQGDFIHQVYPLVGSGYAVIAPDYAGYSNYGKPGNPPSAYASLQDIGKSIVDGARALKKMFPASLGDKVVLTGHSQGGHSAMSALVLADTYASDLSIAAVAVYAPLWQPQRAYAATFNQPANYAFDKSAAGPVGIWYHYSHAELLDGPGKGLELFKADKRTAIKDFVDNTCWSAKYPNLEALGASAIEVYETAFVDAILYPSAGLAQCQGADKDLCDKWMKRYREDRPTLGAKASQVPLLVLWGTGDKTITPDIATCVFERVKTDSKKQQVCLVRGETHGGIVSARADAVSDWITATVNGQAYTPPCDADATGNVDDGGAAVPCNTLISSD